MEYNLTCMTQEDVDLVRAEFTKREKSLFSFFSLIVVSGAFVVCIPQIADLISKYKYLCCRPRCKYSKDHDHENKLQIV